MSLTVRQHNFHLPLPVNLYRELRAEADRRRMPATIIARQAIEAWLERRQAEVLHMEIAAYAARHAGTAMDLDQDLETASLEILMDETKNRPLRKRKKG